MNNLVVLFSFIFGAVIGSFLNVLIIRYNTGFGIKGRSRCLSCGRQLTFFDLIPILSFIFLGGRCRFCKSKISWQYPLVEFITGLVFATIFYRFLISGGFFHYFQDFLSLIITLVYFSLLIAISVYDFKHKIIPNGMVWLTAFLSLSLVLSDFFSNSFSLTDLTDMFWNILAGPLVALPLFLLWLVSFGKWMGFGDPKLALGIGWFLGLKLGFSALILSFWLGALVCIALLIIKSFLHSPFFERGGLFSNLKNLTIKSEVPFGPFLVVSAFLVYLLNLDIIYLFTLLNL